MTSDSSRTAATALAVAVGGAVGAALRYQLWRLWPDDIAEFPLTTFAINVMGCFVFGVCAGLLSDSDRGLATIVRALVMFGLLGGFTSFSIFAVQGATLTSPRQGALYLVVTPLVAVSAAWAGRASASALTRSTARAGRHAR
jgi:CrcB protein